MVETLSTPTLHDALLFAEVASLRAELAAVRTLAEAQRWALMTVTAERDLALANLRLCRMQSRQERP